MPAGLGARNRRKMTARLQAKFLVKSRGFEIRDIVLT
jgi:hypothetical protein